VASNLTVSLSQTLKLPVRVVVIDNLPKIVAGGVPVTPINAVLERRHWGGATRASLDTYARAGRLYVEFCAHRGRSLVDITNEEFIWFKNALLGRPFLDSQGRQARLDGERGPRTGDLMLTLLYSIAIDIEELYNTKFDWRRYRGMPSELADVVRSLKGPFRKNTFRRAHQIKFTKPKVTGLPDEQFKKLIRAAYDRWGELIADGDIAFAHQPERFRGALFYRNAGILLTLRYAGSRRCEVAPLRFEDIDRKDSLIYLVTKGHGERLPVLLFPAVREIIDCYAIHFRPTVTDGSARNLIFLSHSTRNYGKPLSAQSVRALVDTLRTALDPPWDNLTTPHTLRHAFGYDLQKYGGPAAVIAGMRHASAQSSEPYTAGPENFSDELLAPTDAKLARLFAEAGISAPVNVEHLD
jgi:site-specific recombinase XerD